MPKHITIYSSEELRLRKKVKAAIKEAKLASPRVCSRDDIVAALKDIMQEHYWVGDMREFLELLKRTESKDLQDKAYLCLHLAAYRWHEEGYIGLFEDLIKNKKW